MRNFYLFIFLILTSAPSFAEGMPTYRLLMLWIAQAEFAGFYIAEADGLYKEAGLNVIIDHPQPHEEIFEALKNDDADMIVTWQISALARATLGEDIVNAGQIAKRSALMLIARKSSGIKKPEDISGRRLGLWIAPSLQAPIISFLKHYNVTQYKILPMLTNVDLFLYGGVDAIVGVYYDEFYRIRSAGINADELTCFYLNDTFPKLVDDGLYCKNSTYQKDPISAQKIVQATLEGWRRAFADKERTLEIVAKKRAESGLTFNIAHERWMLNVMENLIFNNAETNDGKLSKESFEEAMKILGGNFKNITFEKFAPQAQEDVK